MSRFLYILVLLNFCILNSNAISQKKNTEQIILVTPSDCRLLTQHMPDASVEYKPSVDVRGNSVVSADLNGGNVIGIGEDGYSFYMTHDALKEKGLVNITGLGQSDEGKIVLGQVTVKDGDVLWNGTSLKEMDKQRIYMLCDQQAREKRRLIRKR